MKTIKETPRFSYIYDTLYSVSTIIDRITNKQTQWNTGVECQDEIKKVKKMNDYNFDIYCEKQFS